MAYVTQLPIDGDDICMLCKAKPPQEEILTCKSCATPWHVACLAAPPETVAGTVEWDCPDCSSLAAGIDIAPAGGSSALSGETTSELVTAIRKIEADVTLSEQEKARRRQELMSGKAVGNGEGKGKEKINGDCDDGMGVLEGLECAFCFDVLDRPVTTPCGHNFCLKCFQKWIGQGKRICVKCRQGIPAKVASQPRINSTLVFAIRVARMARLNVNDGNVPKVCHYQKNEDRPDTAYTTERAQRKGKANAASGKIFVTIPPDHFGPILAENDPERNLGVLVGETWVDRFECRQWGVHFPHISGIAGQSEYGAQSVVLSGGYLDDEDHGEWFLYTGSGGRDLSGNKRTNKDQAFDQKFNRTNEALRLSCLKGYPVRVVRSHKEKRSSYAPETGLRYDGIYRIEKCWRKVGSQGFKVCRYLFVRCDNNPAPWTSVEHGDRPRPSPAITELQTAVDITERNDSPSWDFSEEESSWKWMKAPPPSRKLVESENSARRKRHRTANPNVTASKKILKEFNCMLCNLVMALPITTPCGHNFCKSCLEDAFAGMTFVRERNGGDRSLRSQKNVMKCPACPNDISDFLIDPQVNRELMDFIESFKNKVKPNEDPHEDDGTGNGNDSEATISDDLGIHGDANQAEICSEDVSKVASAMPEGSSTGDGNDRVVEQSSGSDSPSSPLKVKLA